MTEHNRTAAAVTMLAEIEAWCLSTGTPETTVGHVLFLHPGFVGLLRLRLTVSEEKESATREFMKANPDGYTGALPVTHFNGTKPTRGRPQNLNAGPGAGNSLSDKELAARRVVREACFYCGVRSDIGCGCRRSPR